MYIFACDQVKQENLDNDQKISTFFRTCSTHFCFSLDQILLIVRMPMLKKKFKVKYMVAKQMFGAKQKNYIFKCLGVGWVIFHWEGEDLFRLPPPPSFPLNVTYFAYKCRTRPRSFRLSSSPLTLCCQFKGVKFVELPCGSPIACCNLHVATLKNCHLPSAQLTLLHSWMCWLFYYTVTF